MTATSSFSPTERLDGKTAVITGGLGASGLASARRLAALGARCALIYRSGEQAAAQAQADGLPGSGHLALRADVTDSATLQATSSKRRSG